MRVIAPLQLESKSFSNFIGKVCVCSSTRIRFLIGTTPHGGVSEQPWVGATHRFGYREKQGQEVSVV